MRCTQLQMNRYLGFAGSKMKQFCVRLNRMLTFWICFAVLFAGGLGGLPNILTFGGGANHYTAAFFTSGLFVVQRLTRLHPGHGALF